MIWRKHARWRSRRSHTHSTWLLRNCRHEWRICEHARINNKKTLIFIFTIIPKYKLVAKLFIFQPEYLIHQTGDKNFTKFCSVLDENQQDFDTIISLFGTQLISIFTPWWLWYRNFLLFDMSTIDECLWFILIKINDAVGPQFSYYMDSYLILKTMLWLTCVVGRQLKVGFGPLTISLRRNHVVLPFHLSWTRSWKGHVITRHIYSNAEE